MVSYTSVVLTRNDAISQAKVSIRDRELFDMAYDRGKRLYCTTWAIDPARPRDEVFDSVSIFMHYCGNNITFTEGMLEPRTVKGSDLFAVLGTSTAKSIRATTPLADVEIVRDTMNCTASDRLVQPLADLIMQTGHGRCYPDYDGISVEKLEPDTYRPIDVLLLLRFAYRQL